jgi:hypothetical protein
MNKRPPSIKLLTTRQYKLQKGNKAGYATFGVQLAPANAAGLGTICASAGQCIIGCIGETGLNAFPSHRSARVKRTILYRKFPQAFYDQLQREIDSWKRSQTKAGYELAARPNVLSDQPLMAHTIARLNPDIAVYDYTKLPRPASRRLPNYHLTYSYSEKTTAADLQHCIDNRMNIAVILNLTRNQRMPKFLTLRGRTYPVIDGDKHDLRFKDPSDQTYIVGLRWKLSKDSAERLAAGLAAGLVIDARTHKAPAPAAPGRAYPGTCRTGDLMDAGRS